MNNRINSYDMAESDCKIWLPWEGALFEVDKQTRKAKAVSLFQEESMTKLILYSSIKKVKESIVLAPCSADHIALYNIPECQMKYIPIRPVEDDRREIYNINLKFYKSMVYNSAVYMLGYAYPAIIKLDLDSMQIEYMTDWLEETEQRISPGDIRGYFNDAIVVDDIAWLAMGCTNSVLQYNLKTDSTRVIDLNTSLAGFGGIAFDGKNFWLVGRGKGSGKVVCWNKDTNMVEEIRVFDDDKVWDPFHSPLIINEKVLLFPISASHVYEIDIHTREVKICSDLERLFDFDTTSYLHLITMAPQIIEGRIRFLTGNDYIWHEYDYRNHICLDYDVKVDIRENLTKRMFIKMISEFLMCGREYIEEGRVPLDCYLKFILENNVQSNSVKAGGDTCGHMIYDLIQMCEGRI